MGWIYLITNKLNNKKYVGKTAQDDPNNRWKEHQRDYTRPQREQRPLYKAMIKYGIENFEYQLLEEVDNSKLNEREMYYIDLYNTFGSDGYNATMGGDGAFRLDENEIIELYKKYQNIEYISKTFKHSTKTIRFTLIKHGIPILSAKEALREKYRYKVQCFDIKTKTLIKEFDSQFEAAEFIFNSNRSKAKLFKTVQMNLTRHLDGKGGCKTLYGYTWKKIPK